MKRAPVIWLAALLLLAPSPAAAQADSTLRFHSGQWGARFRLSPIGQGVGALYFTSPTSAWTADIGSTRYGTDGDGGALLDHDLSLTVGRRWYGTPRGHLRTLSGIAGAARYQERSYDDSPGDPRLRTEEYGATGELGFAYFPAPELALSAVWTADFVRFRQRRWVDDNVVFDYSNWRASVGALRLELSLFF